MSKQTIHPEIRQTIKKHSQELKDIALEIHRNPELGYKEVHAVSLQTDLLQKWGFDVTPDYAGLNTAYKAVVGSGQPTFAFLSEYDALPAIGHACGHNLIAAAALGAAKSLAAVMQAEKIPGSLVLIGTPAEESLGGKVIMAREKAFDGLDAVMMAHPSSRTSPDPGSTAVTRFTVTFHGKAAHAAANPELGKNALDAVLLLFQGVNAWRQQLPEASRVHGIITEGGVAPNIIPDKTSCFFYLRSDKNSYLETMKEAFLNIVRGASLMTGTKAETEETKTPYQARKPNRALNNAFVEYATAAGLKPIVPTRAGRGSSDFGDVSQIIPGVHVYFDIAKKTIAGHSVEMREAAASPYGLEQMLRTAEAMAAAGYKFFTDQDFRNEVAKDFQA